MKNIFLSTVAAIAIVAAPVGAFAQKAEGGATERSHSAGEAGGGGGRMESGGGSRMESGGERQGGAERPSGGERPSASEDNSKTGVGGSDASKPTPAPEKNEPKPGADMKSGAKPSDAKPSDAKPDAKSQDMKSGADAKQGGNPDLEKNRPGEPAKSDGEMDKSGSDKSKMDDKSRTETDTDKSRSGSHTSVNISTEQRTSIRQTITSSSTTVKKVSRSSFGDVSISVGTRIPRERITSVTIERLPPKIVEIVPEYRDYSYFVLDDGTIVIVDPASYEIVYVIDA